MKKILLLLTLSFAATAGLPPTSSKGNGEATYSTTFKTDYDTIPVTRNGTTVTIGTIPVSKGGTGSTTQNFVDLSTTQSSIGGSKGFTNPIGIGAAASSTSSLNIAPTLNAGNTQYGLLQNTTFGSGTTTAATGIWSRINTAAASFTLTDGIAFDLVNASKGAGSTITNLTGLMVRDQTQGSNNYGIQNAVSSGANKWGYYGSGTANNAFAGSTRFGSTVAPSATVDITGTLAVSTPIAVSSGGIGASSLTANSVLLGNGTSAIQTVAPGTVGNVLTSNGTTWTASSTAYNVTTDRFSGNGSTTAFTLTTTPATKDNTWVHINGVYQQKDTYSVSGTTLTFTEAPPTGTSNIEVNSAVLLSVGVPSDGTITPAKLATQGIPFAPGVTSTNLHNFSFTTNNGSGGNCTTGACTVVQTGNAVSGVNWTATGSYTLNLARTYSKLICVGSALNAGVGYVLAGPIACSNCASTSWQTVSAVNTTTSVNSISMYQCTGEY